MWPIMKHMLLLDINQTRKCLKPVPFIGFPNIVNPGLLGETIEMNTNYSVARK